MQQSQVESRGAMVECSLAKVECSTIKYSQVEQWQNVVESSRAK